MPIDSHPLIFCTGSTCRANFRRYVVDELLSHAREGVDAHYIHPSMTRLRDASQKIADYMVKQAGFDLIDELTSRW